MFRPIEEYFALLFFILPGFLLRRLDAKLNVRYKINAFEETLWSLTYSVLIAIGYYLFVVIKRIVHVDNIDFPVTLEDLYFLEKVEYIPFAILSIVIISILMPIIKKKN